MELLVLGANGLLGSNLVAHAVERSDTVVAAYHSEPPAFDVETVAFDVVDDEHFGVLLDEYDPDAVVNCAAMIDVDGCEDEAEKAREINGRAPGRLAARAAANGVQFVHISTDYVFDGRDSSPYTESSDTNPVQVYGESKLLGEQRVISAHPNALIPRLSFVYGRRGDTENLEGFPAWVTEQLKAGEEVPLFTDQRVTPSRAGQAAESILDLFKIEAAGPIHIACRSCVTPYEMGEVVAEVLGADGTLLSESSMTDFDRAAERPISTCLDTNHVANLLGREQPTLREDLRRVL